MNTEDNTENSKPKMPLWVLLAFSNFNKRKHAMILIWVSILFTLYCVPLAKFIEHRTITSIFLIDDWSWIAMMIPICFWYVLSLRWMDKNNAWEQLSKD